jgi:hypothetical protein
VISDKATSLSFANSLDTSCSVFINQAVIRRQIASIQAASLNH